MLRIVYQPQYVNAMRKEIKRTASCLARQESQDTMSRFWRLQKGKEFVLSDETFLKQKLNLRMRRRDEQRRKMKKAEEDLRSWHEEEILNRQRQEEFLQRCRAEEEAIRLQQEQAARLQQEAEAERLRQEAEAERLRHEAEIARQRQWEEAMNRQQEEARHPLNDPYSVQLAIYQSSWEGLLAIRRGRGAPCPLLFSQIPWPVLGPTPCHRSELTSERIMQFYSFMLQNHVGGLKALLKAELSKWHPDKFALSELLRVSEEQRSMVEAAAREVSDTLTDAIGVANEQMIGSQPK